MDNISRDAIRKARGLLKIADVEPKITGVAVAGLSAKEIREYSVLNFIRQVTEDRWGQSNCLELETDRVLTKSIGEHKRQNSIYLPLEIQRRTLSVATDGALVGQQQLGYIGVMRNKSVAIRLGARELPNLQGNCTLPTGLSSVIQTSLGTETTTATETEQTFGQIVLFPKTFAAYTRISRLLAIQSSPGAEGIVMSDLAATAALAQDSLAVSAILTAHGTSNISGASLGLAGVANFQSAVALANGAPDASTFGFAASVDVGVLLKTRSQFPTTGGPIWGGCLLDGIVEGSRAITSNQIAAGTLIGGDWSDLILGSWGIVEISVDPYSNFSSGIIGLGSFTTIDAALRHPQSFAIATGVT